MTLDVNLLYFLIIGCEIAFWLMLFSGFAVRYLLKKESLSFYILLCVPLIDLFLLMFAAIDLSNGNNASFAHGLAAAYIGFTVAFGSSIVKWADKWFAHKFANGSHPSNDDKFGWALVVEDLILWMRCIGAVVIIYVLLTAITAFVDDATKTEALQIWFKIPFFTVFFLVCFWSFVEPYLFQAKA